MRSFKEVLAGGYVLELPFGVGGNDDAVIGRGSLIVMSEWNAPVNHRVVFPYDTICALPVFVYALQARKHAVLEEQHVASADEFLGTFAIEDDAGVQCGGAAHGQTCGEVHLDEARHVAGIRLLGEYDAVDSHGASLLGETAAETKIALTKLKESIKDE